VWRHAVSVVETTDAAARLDRISRIERRCARRGRWLLV
jgi:hypothetical protein